MSDWQNDSTAPWVPDLFDAVRDDATDRPLVNGRVDLDTDKSRGADNGVATTGDAELDKLTGKSPEGNREDL